MKLMRLLILLLLAIPVQAADRCREFIRMETATVTAQQFANQCRAQLPAGFAVQRVGRRFENLEWVRHCTYCPANQPAPPSNPPVADHCRRFSRMMNGQSPAQFRDLCHQRLPAGYVIQSITNVVQNAEFVRVCRMCPDYRQGLGDFDRGINGKDTSGTGHPSSLSGASGL